EQAEHKADLYRFWLMLFALSAALYGGYSLLRVTRARAESMRALAELEFQKFALDQHSIVSIADRRGEITYINQRFTDISQYECDEIVGKDHRVLNSGYHPYGFFKQMWQTIGSGEVWHGEICNRRKDGSLYWVDSTIVPFMDTQGKPTRFVSIRTDITARKAAEAVMQAAKEAAEEASRAKSDFLANMSHEIRTPMNGIIGMTELALDTELNAEQREYLGLVQTSSSALLTIINDILDFSKIEAGKMDIEHIDFALPEMLAQTMASIAPRAHQKGLELLLDIAPEVPVWVKGDPGRLRQIILNLLSNAMKFTDAGEIALRVTLPEATADAESLRICMSVSDTGIGIPADKLQTIFESFSQADASTTRKYGGTGLGLTISTRLVELMQGHIRVESEVGKGSVFHMELSLLRSEKIEQPIAPSTLLEELRVLVVDDHAGSRAITNALLQRWKMRVTTLATASEAWAELQAAALAGDAYRVLLVDAQLQDGDGYQLVAQARALQGEKLAPILLLAASGQRDEVTRCTEAAIPYLYKPVIASTLLNALVATLGGRTEVAVSQQKNIRVNQQQLNILLAEDNSVNQILATRLLEKFGHRVTVAGNGLVAVESWRTATYDLILMDVDMPELNGFGATAQIRALEQDSGAHIPIIGLTAHAMQGSRESCIAAGMDGYLSKPIDTKALWTELEGLSVAMASSDEALSELPEETPTLGFELRRALKLMDNDMSLFDEMVCIYRADYPDYLSRLGAAIATQDAAQTRQLAHTLRGMLSVFDVPEVASLAEYIETQTSVDHSNHYARLAQALPKLAEILNGCMSDTHAAKVETTH
ncbi:MAG: response regulator, partial [Gallionella sp.]